jgi:hypothetical protein
MGISFKWSRCHANVTAQRIVAFRLPRNVVASCLLITFAASSAKAQVLLTFGTGTQGALGSPDTHVSMTAGPAGTPANPIIIEPYPLPTPWAPAIAGTHWVTPFASGIDAVNAPIASYTYEFTFGLPAGASSLSMTLGYYVDDYVTGMSLNGHAVTPSGSAGSTTLGTTVVNDPNDFVTGTNVLDITVANVAPSPPGPNNPTGLDLSGTVSGVPEPGSLALLGTVAAAAGCRLCRRVMSRRQGPTEP